MPQMTMEGLLLQALNGALARALALEQQLDQRATETRALAN